MLITRQLELIQGIIEPGMDWDRLMKWTVICSIHFNILSRLFRLILKTVECGALWEACIKKWKITLKQPSVWKRQKH